MKAVWRGQVIAESNETKEVDGYVYFPRTSVKMDLLSVATKTDSDKECANGVQFYDVGKGPEQCKRGAWSYEKPGSFMKPVDHWISFWKEVEVQR